MATQKAYFGGGCFWCTEAIFQRLKGVSAVTSGYAGGKTENPSYEQVSGQGTGHAELIEVVFDPSIISYQQLLDVFFHTHNPTTLNKQGADEGTQYRSIILTTSDEQMAEAKKKVEDLTTHHEYDQPIVTQIEPLGKFYSAEKYHQKYYEQNRGMGYCELVITPKVEAFQRRYRDLLNPDFQE